MQWYANLKRRRRRQRQWAALVLLVLLILVKMLHKPRVPALTPYQREHLTTIQTGATTPMQLVSFACSLSGTPYKYASADPDEGFDCSGFVTYVFGHFNIIVPRTTTDFAPVHRQIPLKDATLGDIIIFTGLDSTNRVAGHMGIVSSLPGEPLKFIHSTSGKASGVVETDFHTPYYEVRYLKTIRVFPQNDKIAQNAL